jgi:hypothetical protein
MRLICLLIRTKSVRAPLALRQPANAIASMRKVSVLRNLIATSPGSCGLREIGGGDYTEN